MKFAIFQVSAGVLLFATGLFVLRGDMLHAIFGILLAQFCRTEAVLAELDEQEEKGGN